MLGPLASRFSALCAPFVLACASGSQPEPPTPSAPPERPPEDTAAPEARSAPVEPVAAPTPEPFVPPGPLPERFLAFDGACEAGEAITVAAVGDILLHHELQRQAYAAEDRYLNLWSGIVDLLSRADLTYANLEGPTAFGITRRNEIVDDPGLVFDNAVYSGYARFNYHPSLAEDLLKSGVDVVSTANNHALDRWSLGVDRTLDALDKAGLRHTGTRRKGSQDPWHTVTEAGGIRVAWLACTELTNFERDRNGQVLYCDPNKDTIAKLVETLIADPAIDAVIVTPHWGKEYATAPNDKQRKLARRLVEAGAIAVIGAHPHVLQPWEKITTEAGREGFVIYSLGNFASHQRDLPRRTTVILYLGLAKRDDGSVTLTGVGYVPLHVRMEGNKARFFVEAIDRVGGPADSRALVVGMFGEPNLLHPDDRLDLVPHCRPDWAFWAKSGS